MFGVAIALVFVVAASGAGATDYLDTELVDAQESDRLAREHQTWHVRLAYLIAVNGPYDAPGHTHNARMVVDTTGVDRWRTLAAEWLPADKVDEALAIIWCESRGDPSIPNPTSSALGLWQFLKGWYSGAWSSAVGVFDPRDPVASMRAAAIVSKNGTYWGDWSESRHCHGL